MQINPKKKQSTVIEKLAIGGMVTVMVLVVSFVVFFTTKYQFEIYKKKHGDNMTFIDFIFDAERK